MNAYIPRMKDAILDYLGKAQQTEAKIKEAHEIYLPDSAEKEETYLRGKLADARKEAESRIDAVIREGSRGAEEWGRLDGTKLTADAQLLQGNGVTPAQFDQLVERYQDNYTMLDQLRKYGEARNAEAAEKAHAKDNHFPAPAYNVTNIPSPDAKVQEWNYMRQRAAYFLNVADGTGFPSEFERQFARNAADKQFEAWGADAPKPTPTEGAAAAFTAAWGFGPK